MPGRPTECQHGTPLYNSWRDCPYCVEEMERDYQTQLLEKIAYNSSRSSTSISVPTPEVDAQQQAQNRLRESQEMARLAEERFLIPDLIGALKFVSQAIEIEPSFVPFYYQRARYLASQGRKEQAISDLRTFCRANSENFIELENQFKTGKLNEFPSIKPEFETLIHEIKGNARIKANYAISSVEAEAAKMRVKFKEKPVPEFVNNAENSLSKLKQSGESDSYIAVLEVPKTAEEVKNEVRRASVRYDNLQNRTRESLANAELKLRLISTSRGHEFTSEKLQSSQNNFEEAKKLFQNPSFSNLSKCLEFSENAIKGAEAGKTVIEESLARQRQPFEETLLRIHNEHEKTVSSIQKKYNDKIYEYREVEDRRERDLRRFEPFKAGSFINFLFLAAAFLGTHFLVELLKLEEHIANNPNSTNDDSFLLFLMLILFAFVFLVIRYLLHNADEPQPKRLTGENRANRKGNDWEILFSFLISVYSVFSVLKNLCFFCTHFTCYRLELHN